VAVVVKAAIEPSAVEFSSTGLLLILFVLLLFMFFNCQAQNFDPSSNNRTPQRILPFLRGCQWKNPLAAHNKS
jgi:hypothetical protein